MIFLGERTTSILDDRTRMFNGCKAAKENLARVAYFDKYLEFADLAFLGELYLKIKTLILVFNKIESLVKLISNTNKLVIQVHELMIENNCEMVSVFNQPKIKPLIEGLLNNSESGYNRISDSVGKSLSNRTLSVNKSFNRESSGSYGKQSFIKESGGKSKPYKVSIFKPKLTSDRHIKKNDKMKHIGVDNAEDSRKIVSLKEAVDGNAFSDDVNGELDPSKDSFIQLSKEKDKERNKTGNYTSPHLADKLLNIDTMNERSIDLELYDKKNKSKHGTLTNNRRNNHYCFKDSLKHKLMPNHLNDQLLYNIDYVQINPEFNYLRQMYREERDSRFIRSEQESQDNHVFLLKTFKIQDNEDKNDSQGLTPKHPSEKSRKTKDKSKFAKENKTNDKVIDKKRFSLHINEHDIDRQFIFLDPLQKATSKDYGKTSDREIGVLNFNRS